MHVEFYIMSWDSTTKDFFEALAEVAGRGVKVRLMFDHIGTARIPGYRDMIKKLQQTAIEWHPMLPIQPLKGKWRRPDLRNHRKIVVVDGRTPSSPRLRNGLIEVPTAGLRPGRHSLLVDVSDYQETRNMENVRGVLPNTREVRTTFVVRP